MANDSSHSAGTPPVLVVVAAPLEALAVSRAFNGPREQGGAAIGGVRAGPLWTVRRLAPGFRLIETGIGKVNAAAAVVRALERGRYRAVVNLGVAGALPGSHLNARQLVLADASVYADEGLGTPSGFVTCDEMGFPLGPFRGNGVASDPGLLGALAPMVESSGGRVGVIATVSTCSGTDPLARDVVERTGAIAEGMEGAAIAHTVARYSHQFPRRGAPFIELRVISNSTGNRESQRWDLRGALESLTLATADVRKTLEAWAPTL